MIENILIIIVALTFSMLATPLARQLALRVGVISVPRSAERDMHIKPVPLLGGAAIYAAFIITLLFFGHLFYIRELIGIMVGATLISLFGLTDDRWELSPGVKMIGQLLAGIVLLLGGVQAQVFPYEWMNWAITLFWVVGITNAINFLDNMDGLSAGLASIAAGYFLLLAVMNDPVQVLVAALAAAMIGASLGFLRYNLNPATIFMGDTGSMFLGFMLAALAIKLRFLGNTPLVTWLVPVAVLALPIFDTTLIVVSRLRQGRNPFNSPGKDHISHRLVALGMTRREAVLTCYIIAFICGMIGTYVTQANLIEAMFVAVLMGIAGIIGIVWLERVCPGGKRRVQATDEVEGVGSETQSA